jgi:anaerobic magnesium-protoporphyrin IX monomethyl ester cyclase
MYNSTFSSAFYKKLHRYIHNRYKIQRGINQIKLLRDKPAIPSISNLKKIGSMVFSLPLSYVNELQLKKLSHSKII